MCDVKNPDFAFVESGFFYDVIKWTEADNGMKWYNQGKSFEISKSKEKRNPTISVMIGCSCCCHFIRILVKSVELIKKYSGKFRLKCDTGKVV